MLKSPELTEELKAACHYMVILKGKKMLQEGREKGSTLKESKIKRGFHCTGKGGMPPYLGLFRGWEYKEQSEKLQTTSIKERKVNLEELN